MADFAGVEIPATESKAALPQMTENVEAKADRIEAPKTEPRPTETPAASKPEGRKRGRPRKAKAEDEAVVETKTATAAKTNAGTTGKKQKSLFDF
jgi:hypothetical protein